MFKLFSMAAGVLLAAGLAAGAHAAGNDDVERARADLEQQLKALRADYEARLRALERQAAPGAAPAARGNAFNPEISLILQGGYLDAQQGLRRPSGYLQDAEIGAPARGFSIGGTELLMSANIDAYTRGAATFSVGEGQISVEEAWFQTLALGHGFTVKGGRFLSGIGYQNEQHPHAWDFNDNNLMYQVLFGEHLAHDGVQLKWLAPTDHFLELGAEFGNGAGFPGSPADRNGVGGWSAFAHTGGDVGESHSWRAGVSYLSMRALDRRSMLVDSMGAEAEVAFSGRSNAWVADLVWKWAPQGNASVRNLKLQLEAFEREETGDLGYDPAGLNASAAYHARQRGGYVQAVYQFMPRWRAGVRHERLAPGTQDYGANSAYLSASDYSPHRASLMLDYAPSEFSRLRLQVTRNRAMQDNPDDRVISLQYVHSLGAHGAHQF